MEWTTSIFSLAGGLGLFIFGMKTMSDSLQMVAGERLKAILGAVSSNRFVACLTGITITGIIQSSSATSVMLVGFVNAGLMNLTQATGVALGAKIGTTVTAQLLAFNITEAALPAIAIGCFFKVFANRRNVKEMGGVVLGFGLLFYGLVLMSQSVAPFKESEMMVEFFTKFSADTYGGIILCVLVGMICTMIVQSSSVTVGLTMALASQGLLGVSGAMALVIGDNIGTTITAEIAAIGTGLPARRTARANSLASLFGAAYMIVLFPYYEKLVIWVTNLISSEPDVSRYVANSHTIFNVVNSLVFLMLLPFLVKLAIALTPKKGYDEATVDLLKTQHLDESFLKTPTVALSQSRKEIVRMAEISMAMTEEVVKCLEDKHLRTVARYKIMEEALDNLQKEIHNYLTKLYSEPLTHEEHLVIGAQMNLANIIERVGDTTNNIADLIVDMSESGVTLSAEGMADYKTISNTALTFHQLVTGALREGRISIMPQAMQLEEDLDRMHQEMRDGHLNRLKNGQCQVHQGLIFTDMLNHFERLGDYLLKLSKAWISYTTSTL